MHESHVCRHSNVHGSHVGGHSIVHGSHVGGHRDLDMLDDIWADIGLKFHGGRHIDIWISCEIYPTRTLPNV